MSAAMLSLDELLDDPLLQVWDADRVVTALTLALSQRRVPEIQRWFFFGSQA
jgi:hypothetical protein